MPHIDTEQLLHSLGLSGAALPSKLLASLRKLSGARQSGVLEHAAAVVKQLCSSAVGLTGEQAGRLLEARPLLFSWPPEEGAALQLGQLRAAGLTVEAAVSCLLALPAEGGYRSFEDGLAELADILAHSADRESSHGGRKPAVPAAQRTTAALLTLKPAVIRLVLNKAGHLQQCSQQLQQAGWSAAEVAALVWYRPSFLASDSVQRLQQAIGVLVQQLGLTPAEVVGAVISIKPSWLTSSIDTLGRRAAALAEVRLHLAGCTCGRLPAGLPEPGIGVLRLAGAAGPHACLPLRVAPPSRPRTCVARLLQGFGQSAARSMFKAYPNILGCAPEVWRRNLVYMEACGVSGPSEVLAEHCKLVNLDHAAPAFLQRRLLLQRGFGLTPAQLYGQRAWSLSESTAPALAQRLQFVQHRGQLQRLAATGLTGGAASRLPPHQRPLSLRLLLVGEQADLLEAVGATAGDWASWAAANPPEECALYREAQQAAEAEAARLTAALPHELQAWQPKPNSRKGARRKSAE